MAKATVVEAGAGREEQMKARAPQAMWMARNRLLQEAEGSGGVLGGDAGPDGSLARALGPPELAELGDELLASKGSEGRGAAASSSSGGRWTGLQERWRRAARG